MSAQSEVLSPAKVQHLAEALDFATSDELQALARISPSTEEAWAKRGTGPAYVMFGNARLYPRPALRAFLLAKVRARGAALAAKELL